MKVSVKDLTRPVPTRLQCVIQVECLLCHETSVLAVDKEDYQDWQGGKYIQDAFPYLEPWERDLIKLGLHKQCQIDLYKEQTA